MNKDKIITFLLLLLLPINIFAYSNYLIPGGESIGIEIKSNGILVVGFYKVNGKFNRGLPELQVGDKILSVNGTKINTINELIDSIESGMKDNKVSLKFLRDKKEKNTILELIEVDGTYKTGLYVKDSIAGIGTLTYIDPESKIYGALGHEIIESNSNKRIEVREGTIFKSKITSVDRSVGGRPGGKNAKFYSNKVYGNIIENKKTGIYGKYSSPFPEKSVMPIAELDEVKNGDAYIYTVLNDEIPEKFKIEITNVDHNSKIKNIFYKVTDKRLLEKTGGIVQGMSGSPIIQNGKIIGAVTHVVISNPERGYGISIINMLKDGEK